MPNDRIDPTTNRPSGDHGPARLAIEYALDGRKHDHDPANALAFLEAWNEGGAADGWPEFYEWLKEAEAHG